MMDDPETEAIVIIGEIGGNMENEAAEWIKDNGTKPVIGFIAGQTAPKGRRMGHAGAIIGGKNDTAAAKMEIMRNCGIHVVQSPADIGITVTKAVGPQLPPKGGYSSNLEYNFLNISKLVNTLCRIGGKRLGNIIISHIFARILTLLK
jgi:hypothetical protein